MRKFLIVAVVWSLAACATGPQIQAKENMLSAAGFVIQPANTPARIASLRQLPAHTFVWKSQGDKLLTLYSDPTICGCLYVGDQKAYQAYRREVLRKQLADEARMTAMENTNNMMMDDWGWGPWGNFGNDPFSYY